MGRSKYNNKKIEVDGITFDSRREANRYKELKLLEQSGEISNIERQKRFELIPKQKDANGRTVRACCYVADFVYTDKEGRQIVEDVKGMRTDVYKIKKKLMLYVHGVTVIET